VRSPLRESTTYRLERSIDNSRLNLSSSMTNFKSTSNLNNISTYSYPSYEEENFISYLKEVIARENEIERSKCDLVLRSDFNVEDAFRVFELDGRGYLTDLDLKYGLNALDIYPSSEEINLLIRRYDARNEGVISYANFFEIVAPLDREYRRMLEGRLPSGFEGRFNKADVFLPTTKLYLQNLMNLHLRSESRIEGWRQRLNKMLRFNTRTIFERIDRLEKGYVNETDLSSYLKRNDVAYLMRDVDLVLIRLDRDRDGRISYLEVKYFYFYLFIFFSFLMKFILSQKNYLLFKSSIGLYLFSFEV
jgi:Ca2+-binding EF-hand superfamily protein